jgi:hypothetical protein
MHGDKIIIFDWDDTLFPKCLATTNTKMIDYDQLHILDQMIVKLFYRILSNKKHGLYIVTNSQGGWLEKTSAKYLPGTHFFIEQHNNDNYNFCIISSRSSFEGLFPNDPIAWKICAFKKILEEKSKTGRVAQIISYGDGIAEKMALLNVSKKNGICGKSIQFLDSPTQVTEIIAQIDLVFQTLDEILNTGCNLDINIIKDCSFYYVNNLWQTKPRRFVKN